MAAAKREGAVTWYTSTPIGTARRSPPVPAETGIKGGAVSLRRPPRASPLHAGNRCAAGDRPRDEIWIRRGHRPCGQGRPMPKNWTISSTPSIRGSGDARSVVHRDPAHVIGRSREVRWEFTRASPHENDPRATSRCRKPSRAASADARRADQYSWLDARPGTNQTIWPTDGPSPSAADGGHQGRAHPRRKALDEFMISDAVAELCPGRDLRRPVRRRAPAGILRSADQAHLGRPTTDRKDAKNLKTFNEIYQ